SGDGNDRIIEQADPTLPVGLQKPGWVIYEKESGEQIALVGGSKDSNGTLYQSADQRFTYDLNGTTLRIGIQGEAGSITIENFQNHDYGIRLQVGCAQTSLVALTSPLELVSGLTAIAKTRPTSYWLAPPATLTSDLPCWGSPRARRSFCR